MNASILLLNWDEISITSPPSPEFDFPPILFIAIAIASWVSLDIAPRDIPPVQNRFTIDKAGSTFPTGMGARSLLNSRRSRRTCNEQKISHITVIIKSIIMEQNYDFQNPHSQVD
jgi:hypothetical protein